ncbi:MAG: hypothetical protein R3250_09505, partial [Melioribacteraceae bacterium]|nr:hypothetical protein [Melioribacteraceae bacterium]
TAKLINNDFGGLHLERLGRDPTMQHIFRFLALAPDWTESNFRTVLKLFKQKGEDAAAIRQMYRDFWFRIATKGFVGTVLLNTALALSLGEDGEFEDKLEDLQDFFNKARKKYIKGLRQLGKGNVLRGYNLIKQGVEQTDNMKDIMFKVDITPLYRYFGGDRHTRKYFSLYGHFLDPLKALYDPAKVVRHKGSMFSAASIELLTGEDWRGRPYSTLAQLLEDRTLTVFKREYDPHGIPYVDGYYVSYLISQIIGATPIPVQNGVSWISGETEGFDAAARTIGLQVSTKHD